jgi:colicin import membrane protein
MTDEDRRVLELQKRREANIRKKEQQRIEAEALEEQKQKHFLELEKQRQSVISQKEEEWALKEEAQRKKDEATILYIREARERRRQEKEAEKQELEEELKRQQKLEQVCVSVLTAFFRAQFLSLTARRTVCSPRKETHFELAATR